MRERKFRVWDEDEKKFWFFTLQEILERRISYSGSWDLKIAKGIKSEFTGLKDKKGVEINEGDIVEFIGGTCDYLICGNYGEKHTIGAKLVVKCLESGWTLIMPNHVNREIPPNLVGNVDNYQFWNHQRSLVVIGNIHENPELL